MSKLCKLAVCCSTRISFCRRTSERERGSVFGGSAYKSPIISANGMAVRPFHKDKNPGLKVDKRFHCFGCRADGWNPLFVEAMQKREYVGYLLDTLLTGTKEVPGQIIVEFVFLLYRESVLQYNKDNFLFGKIKCFRQEGLRIAGTEPK